MSKCQQRRQPSKYEEKPFGPKKSKIGTDERIIKVNIYVNDMAKITILKVTYLAWYALQRMVILKEIKVVLFQQCP